MTFKVTTSRNVQNLFKKAGDKTYVNQIKKEFSKRGPVKVKQAIVQDMIKGISPVQGGGKWAKYSPSYKKEIRKGTSKKMRDASPSKRVTPVNLRLTGGLHRSLTSFFKRNALIIQFKSFLADIHNRRGAGKSKTKRRLLPTEKGEQFNRRINKVLFDQLKKAADTVAKQFSGQ